jgi:signal transduction histidine kinase
MADLHSDARLDYRQLFNALPGLYLILLSDFTIIDASDAYLSATMTQRADIIGKGIFEVFPDNPADAQADGVSNLRASLERVRRDRVAHTMAVQRYDIRRPAAEGGGFEERFWSPHNAPVLNAAGVLQAIVHRVEDVTPYVRLQTSEREQQQEIDDLRNRTIHMEAEIFMRAQEIAQANRELERLNASLRSVQESKDLLAGMIVHDLRNPLTAALGSLEILEDKHSHEASDEARHLSRAREATLRQMEMVNGIIDVMRMEDGHMRIRLEEVDVVALVAARIDQYQGAAVRAGIGIGMDVARAHDTRGFRTDPALLGRILDNLISNALKHTPRGGAITVGARPCSDQPRGIVVTVADTGEGIAPENLGKLFSKYGRVEGQHGGRAYDTGLGLLFCRMAVELLGGSIAVDSALHHGSTFTITLREPA